MKPSIDQLRAPLVALQSELNLFRKTKDEVHLAHADRAIEELQRALQSLRRGSRP
jgi:hypothetical protein